MTSLSATPDRYPYQNEPIGSRSEKAIARKAFDAALQRELHEVMQEAKRMANRIMQASVFRDFGTLPDPTAQRNRPQVRLPVFATHPGARETSARRSTHGGRTERPAGRQAGIYPFSREISGGV